MPSDLNSFIFAVALIIFGVGLEYLMPGQLVGAIFVLVGLAGILYATRSLFPPRLIEWYWTAHEVYPYAAPIVAGTVAMLMAAVLLGGGSWLLLRRGISSVSKGSMQYKETEIPREHPLTSIGVGKQFVVNWLFTNPGPGRVFNLLSFYKAYVEAADEETDQRVKILFENDRTKALARKLEGPEVSPGIVPWMTIRSPPLTQQQYEGVLKGTTRMYFVAWLRWTDAQGYEDPPLYRCVWLQGNSLLSARRPEDLVWHACGW